jgi:hypothetical protein
MVDCGESNTATDSSVTWAFPECSDGSAWSDFSCVQPCGVPSDFDWSNEQYVQDYVCSGNNYEWCATTCPGEIDVPGYCAYLAGNSTDDGDDDDDCSCGNDDDYDRRRLGGRAGDKNAAQRTSLRAPAKNFAQHAPWSSRVQRSSSAAKPASQKAPEPKRKPLNSAMQRRLSKKQARDAMAEMAKKAPVPNLPNAKKASDP